MSGENKQVIEAELVEEEAALTETQSAAQMPALTQADRLLEIAITKGTDMAQLEKLMDLKERYDKEEARKAFTAALAAFKGEGVVISKDRTVGFETQTGFTSYTHASLGNIIEVATPCMSKHGLSHRWLTDQGDGVVKVTCILTHKAGHSESTTLQAAPDGSGKKNAIQQVSSTITYLERYTFLAITGLAVKEQDDDGQTSEPPPPEITKITESQHNLLHSKMTDNGLDVAIVMDWVMKVFPYVKTLSDLSAEHYEKVDKKLNDTIKKKQEAENS